VTRGRDGALACGPADQAADPDIGAFQERTLTAGPDYLNRGDEQPRLVRTAWLKSADGVRLEVAFSTPMQDPPSGAYAALRSEDGNTVAPEPCRKVPPAVLDCRFPGLEKPPAVTATLLLSRSVKSSGGKPVTLWAAEFLP
jgi:hypothetical protein